jgi:hypothetical protein
MRSPPLSEPANNQFFLPRPSGRIARSAMLLSGMLPSALHERSAILSCHVRIVVSGQGRRSAKKRAGRIDFELRARVVIWPPLRLSRLRCERVSVDVAQPAHALPLTTWRIVNAVDRNGCTSKFCAGRGS